MATVLAIFPFFNSSGFDKSPLDTEFLCLTQVSFSIISTVDLVISRCVMFYSPSVGFQFKAYMM